MKFSIFILVIVANLLVWYFIDQLSGPINTTRSDLEFSVPESNAPNQLSHDFNTNTSQSSGLQETKQAKSVALRGQPTTQSQSEIANTAQQPNAANNNQAGANAKPNIRSALVSARALPKNENILLAKPLDININNVNVNQNPDLTIAAKPNIASSTNINGNLAGQPADQHGATGQTELANPGQVPLPEGGETQDGAVIAEDNQIISFSAKLLTYSNEAVPFVNLFMTKNEEVQFINESSTQVKESIYNDSIHIGSTDERGMVNFSLPSSNIITYIFSEYAGETQAIFHNIISKETAWNQTNVYLDNVDGIYTIRGKVVDEYEVPIRYAELITDERYLEAAYQDKHAGSFAKTDKYGKYLFSVKVSEFPFTVFCKVKDYDIAKHAIDYANYDSLFIDNVDFIIAKDKNFEAIKKGIDWLVQQQNASTGVFSDKLPQTNTALACLALLAHGYLKKESEYKEPMRKGILHLCDFGKKNNYYFKDGRMYSHALVSLALSEAYGTLASAEENELVKEVLNKTIEHIVNAQNKTKDDANFGGWRYVPKSKDTDLSVSALQILALHSAKNNDIEVPIECLEDASVFVRSHFSPSTKSFTYQPGKNASAAMKSAGVVAMNLLKLNNSKEDLEKITQSASYLLTYKPNAKLGNNFWYTSYYMFTAASIMGGTYSKFIPTLKENIISVQNSDGSFDEASPNGTVFNTAFALIILGSPLVD